MCAHHHMLHTDTLYAASRGTTVAIGNRRDASYFSPQFNVLPLSHGERFMPTNYTHPRKQELLTNCFLKIIFPVRLNCKVWLAGTDLWSYRNCGFENVSPFCPFCPWIFFALVGNPGWHTDDYRWVYFKPPAPLISMCLNWDVKENPFLWCSYLFYPTNLLAGCFLSNCHPECKPTPR